VHHVDSDETEVIHKFKTLNLIAIVGSFLLWKSFIESLTAAEPRSYYVSHISTPWRSPEYIANNRQKLLIRKGLQQVTIGSLSHCSISNLSIVYGCDESEGDVRITQYARQSLKSLRLPFHRT